MPFRQIHIRGGGFLPEQDSETPILISLKETARRTSLNRTTIWEMARTGTFPKPVLVGVRRKAFVETEINDFIRSRIAAR